MVNITAATAQELVSADRVIAQLQDRHSLPGSMTYPLLTADPSGGAGSMATGRTELRSLATTASHTVPIPTLKVVYGMWFV